jgi:ABC-type molybdate transport system substrate-binding protein
VIVLAMAGSMACADELVVYGAGSLRGAIGQIASQFGHAAIIQLPSELQVGPEYALDVLKDAPAAQLLALTILSP